MRHAILCGLLLLSMTAASTSAFADDTPEKKGKPEVSWAHIELEGSYPEGAQMPGLFGDLRETLAGLVARLDKAATDPKVSGVILRINDPSIGWAKLNAFREAIGRIRAKDKKVIAYLDGASNMDYLLASACDQVVMPESGVLMVVGLRAEVSFYKNLFDLIGVKAEMLRVGEFKSAAEPYSRTEMSPEFRKEMEEILDDYYAQIVATIAKSRNLPEDKVKAAIDAGPQSAHKAKVLGLIDRVGYQDEVEAAIQAEAGDATLKIVKKYGKKKLDTDFSGFSGMMKFMEVLMGVEPARRRSTAPRIAVIYASGPISSGHSKSDLFSGESTLGSETIIKAIREANKDPLVKGIVLRVDSPGGSALASDLMWRELELIKKPFVASMSDVAASGGYYIAMGADRIFAEPGTLTGSIGVVGGKLALEGLYNKIGITTSVISRGKNSGVMSGTSGFTDSERASMQQLLNEVYDQFTTKAAQGRKMDKDKLEKLARGRVYTGTMAHKIGLVDELGSLDDAVAAAQKMAGFKPDDKLERLNLPKPVSPFEQLFGPIDASPDVTSGKSAVLLEGLRSLSPELARNLGALSVMKLLAREPVLMVLPFQLIVK